MEITRDTAATRAALESTRRQGRRIGLVPTMGYLHAGHLSLVEAARRDDTSVVVSIFVNPMQFGPHEDLDRYPRDEEGDLRKCREAGVELVFAPHTDVMYDADAATTVSVAGLTDTLCGPCRPGHFTGVATIVAKLFNIVRPDVAYFGRKDAQQLAVIRRMVHDLNMPIRIVGCPIVREPDGLAISSRNALLSPDERRRALVLYGALCAARSAIEGGRQSTPKVLARMNEIVAGGDPSAVDYISIVDPDTLQPVESIDAPVLVALAVWIGQTRLIDNLLIDPHGRRP